MNRSRANARSLAVTAARLPGGNFANLAAADTTTDRAAARSPATDTALRTIARRAASAAA